jgi:hypothetical protein
MLDLSDHPIMDAICNTLFPFLPSGHYLTAMRDKLQIIGNGASMTTQLPSVPNDGRVATIHITLPVRFSGGALVVRESNGSEERYTGGGGRSADIDWTAFLVDCEHEVETVHHGYKLFISYGVYPRTFGPQVDPLIIQAPISLITSLRYLTRLEDERSRFISLISMISIHRRLWQIRSLHRHVHFSATLPSC